MDEIDFSSRSLISMLKRQLRFVVVLVLGLMLMSAVVLFSLTPLYSASALVLVDTSPKNLLDRSFENAATQIDDTRVSSEVEIAQSAPVLLEVISQANLVSDPEFGVRLGLKDRLLAYLQITRPELPTGEAALQRVLDSLKNAISVDRRPRTNLLTLSIRSTSPEKAARLTNMWANAYIKSQVTAKIDSSLLSRDALQARVESARLKVVSSEGQLDSFLDQNIAKITAESGRSDLSDMRVKIASLDAERTSSTDLASALERDLAGRNWSALVASLNNQALQELERQRQLLSNQVSQASAAVTTDLRAQLAAIEQRMLDAAQGELSNLRDSVVSYSGQADALRQQLRSAVLSGPLGPDLLAKAYELQQTSELARSQYQTLLSRVQDLDIQASLQLADSRIVAEAMTPQRPSFPNTPILLSLSMAGSTILALGLAFLRENMVGGLLSVEQATAVLRAPVASAVPRVGREAGGSPADMVVDSMLSPYAESIRRIRATLEQQLRRARPPLERSSQSTVIMMTSAAPREGKSTIALSLARSMAVAKRRVLLIDCDLRRPSLHAAVGLDQDDGLRQLLEGDVEATDRQSLLTPDPKSSATLVLGSSSFDLPTDQLVGSQTFAQLIGWARAHYDVVILDSPPIGSVVDGLYIAPLSDAVLYVVRAGATRQAEAKAGLAAITGAKREDTVVMVVLNQQDRMDASYGKQYSNYGY
ncbi:polysaccharide biosynthesis tyrosine autokinase [Devosia sp.]|uniref:GumC family protein n=1 Tax=Devosia sp. TaxID=1871048 RepID=UPI001AC56CF5|nr:polysaccharide biosynthesis tyrosine autokinase [Devosia sp.]MBN9309604.1 AAA family ATPase [Devosia sp.]